jgi:hypothetical protein
VGDYPIRQLILHPRILVGKAASCRIAHHLWVLLFHSVTAHWLCRWREHLSDMPRSNHVICRIILHAKAICKTDYDTFPGIGPLFYYALKFVPLESLNIPSYWFYKPAVRYKTHKLYPYIIELKSTWTQVSIPSVFLVPVRSISRKIINERKKWMSQIIHPPQEAKKL